MKKHGKGGSIINTASMVAIVGSAAPQLACIRTYDGSKDRYRVKGSGVGDVARIGDCTCQGRNQSQFSVPRTIEHPSFAKLLGYT